MNIEKILAITLQTNYILVQHFSDTQGLSNDVKYDIADP